MNTVKGIVKEVQKPTLEQLQAQSDCISAHMRTIADKMYTIEQYVLEHPEASMAVIEQQYKEADRLSKIWNWLNTVYYNRFILPVEQAKHAEAKAQQEKQSREGRIIH